MSGHSVLTRFSARPLRIAAAVAAMLLYASSPEARTGAGQRFIADRAAAERLESLVPLYATCSNYPCLSVGVEPARLDFITSHPSRCDVYYHRTESAAAQLIREISPCNPNREDVIARSGDERSLAITWTQHRLTRRPKLFVLPTFADPPQAGAGVSFHHIKGFGGLTPTITGMAWLQPRVLQVNVESRKQVLVIGRSFAFATKRFMESLGRRSDRPNVVEVPNTISGRYKLTFDAAGGFVRAEYLDMPAPEATGPDDRADAGTQD